MAEKHNIALAMPGDKDRTYAIYLDMIKGRLNSLAGVAAELGLQAERCLVIENAINGVSI